MYGFPGLLSATVVCFDFAEVSKVCICIYIYIYIYENPPVPPHFLAVSAHEVIMNQSSSK
jgi:hypothetical protein